MTLSPFLPLLERVALRGTHRVACRDPQQAQRIKYQWYQFKKSLEGDNRALADRVMVSISLRDSSLDFILKDEDDTTIAQSLIHSPSAAPTPATLAPDDSSPDDLLAKFFATLDKPAG